MALRCPICARAHLPSESCGKDTEAGVAHAFRSPPAPTVELPIPDTAAQRAAAKCAPVVATMGSIGDLAELGHQIKEEKARVSVSQLETDKAPGFDRAAYQREYMRAYRARRKNSPA